MSSAFDPLDPPSIVLEPPAVPEIRVDPPASDTLHVVPVPGPQGPPGGTGASAFVYTTSNPDYLHQIHHGLLFKPAGVVCIENGVWIEPDTIAHPAPGITELTFGVPVAVTVYLS